MAIQSIVFDFGNVIGYFDHRRAARGLAAHCDLPEDEILRHVCDAEREDAYESGRLTSAAFLQSLRAAVGARCPDEQLGFAYSDIFTPNEEVCTLIPRLAGRYRLLLGSNTTELHAVQFRRQFADTLRHFDAVVLSFEVGARKPKAAFFEYCRRLAGSAPHECLFIDDLPANVAGAVACGWQGIVFRDAADLRRQLAALGIRDAAE